MTCPDTAGTGRRTIQNFLDFRAGLGVVVEGKEAKEKVVREAMFGHKEGYFQALRTLIQ